MTARNVVHDGHAGTWVPAAVGREVADIVGLALMRSQRDAERRGEQWSPPAELLDAVRHMRVAHLVEVPSSDIGSDPHPSGNHGGCESGITCTDEVLTAAEAADVLDCSARWVRKLADEGHLPGSRQTADGVWLIPLAAIETYRRTA